MSRLILSNSQRPKLQVYKLNNCSPVDDLKLNSCSQNSTTLYSIYYQMTDMEELDNTEQEQKKSGYAALREKHAEEVNALKAEIEELKAGRMADKKLYFENTMKNRGYE